MGWTEQRMETLRSLWLEGRSAKTIAEALGGVSRNAVMGKVNRMGLMGSVDHNDNMEVVPQGCCAPTGRAGRKPIAPVEVLDPNAIYLTPGTIAKAWRWGSEVPPSLRSALGFVEELTSRPYDASVRGHMASLIALSMILTRGDPRFILVPRMSEQQVLRMMRTFAEKGMVVGGKTPERWREDGVGETLFYDDMLAAEGVKEKGLVVMRGAA